MLSPDDRPSPSTEAVLRRFGAEEPLLFHPLFGEVVALTPSGFAIWQCLDGRRSVSEIAERVTARCDAAPTDVLSDVTSFLFELRRRGFVVTDPAADTPCSRPPETEGI